MPEQRELPLTFPELSPEAPLIPVRMVIARSIERARIETNV
jgi:hypothetical protein